MDLDVRNVHHFFDTETVKRHNSGMGNVMPAKGAPTTTIKWRSTQRIVLINPGFWFSYIHTDVKVICGKIMENKKIPWLSTLQSPFLSDNLPESSSICLRQINNFYSSRYSGTGMYIEISTIRPSEIQNLPPIRIVTPKSFLRNKVFYSKLLLFYPIIPRYSLGRSTFWIPKNFITGALLSIWLKVFSISSEFGYCNESKDPIFQAIDN